MQHSAVKLTGRPNSGPVAALRQRERLSQLSGFLFAIIDQIDYSVTAYFSGVSIERIRQKTQLTQAIQPQPTLSEEEHL